ncbi:MAG TPA: class I SAM-dependent methyltransferase [Lachnospiraceae bacterium]|nr:class I SAM-dependent methyltransferase [Lachnospiraceae bacterium]
MNIYTYISKFYDLIDVFYFRNEMTSPRKAVLDSIPDGAIKVLDICTGTATNSIHIAKGKKDSTVYAIDLSKEMLTVAKAKIAKEGITNLKTYVMDATNTKFPSQSFDVILISLVLHEIPVCLAERILAEANRLLKPDGKLLIVEWEKPITFPRKCMFQIISMIEPKGFKQFLRTDFEDYFMSKGFRIRKETHCDYSRVYELK